MTGQLGQSISNSVALMTCSQYVLVIAHQKWSHVWWVKLLLLILVERCQNSVLKWSCVTTDQSDCPQPQAGLVE